MHPSVPGVQGQGARYKRLVGLCLSATTGRGHREAR